MLQVEIIDILHTARTLGIRLVLSIITGRDRPFEDQLGDLAHRNATSRKTGLSPHDRWHTDDAVYRRK